MKRFFFFIFIAFFVMGGSALASDQKLVYGAGTLPHLNIALSVEPGYEFPSPIIADFRIDMGLGNRVQLGISLYFWIWGLEHSFATGNYAIGREYHSLFNILKTSNDSDFLSIYFNYGMYSGSGIEWVYFSFPYGDSYTVRSGIAYEHRFYDKHRMGLYVKVGIIVLVVDKSPGEAEERKEDRRLDPDWISLDIRMGYQALLGKRFSVALEPMLLIDLPLEGVQLGGKLSLSWAFDLKRKSRPKQP